MALAEILIGKGVDVHVHDPVINMPGANLRYVQAKLPHLQRVLHAGGSVAACPARRDA